MMAVTVVGDGRPIVVLPMFGCDSAVMAEMVEPAFTGTDGWRRIYLDLPGTGRSPSLAPRSDAVLDAVEATVSALPGVSTFHLLGASYGGYLATGLARRVPATVRGMFLVSTGIRIAPGSRDLSGALASVPAPGWLDDVPADLHTHFEQAVGRQTASVAHRITAALALGTPTDDDYLEDLRTNGYQLSDEGSEQAYDGDVVLLAGRRDRICGHRDQFAALRRYPHGSYVLLDDAGHYLPCERPETFGLLLRDWLANQPAPNPR